MGVNKKDYVIESAQKSQLILLQQEYRLDISEHQIRVHDLSILVIPAAVLNTIGMVIFFPVRGKIRGLPGYSSFNKDGYTENWGVTCVLSLGQGERTSVIFGAIHWLLNEVWGSEGNPVRLQL